MTPEARAELRERLEASRQVVRKSVDRLSDFQWRFAPPEGGWTIAQCLEHITHIETRIIDELGEQIKTVAPDPSLIETLANKEEILKRAIPGRGRKVQMPEKFEFPQGVRPAAKLVEQFEQARDRSIRFLMEATVDIRDWRTDHAFFQTLHGGQWMWMIALHAERHAAQIEEVRRLAEFPTAA